MTLPLKNKMINQTYLFDINKDNYNHEVLNFFKQSETITLDSPGFDDIEYDIKKRQISPVIVSLLKSKDIRLLTSKNPMPRSMKVFTAKDIKSTVEGKRCIYIDITAILDYNGGKYICTDIDKFVAYLMEAYFHLCYYNSHSYIFMNNIVEHGAGAFASLLTNIVNYLFKINSINGARNRCIYLSCLYFLRNIVGSNSVNSVYATNVNIAKKISKLTDREVELIDSYIEKDSFSNINKFIATLSRVLKVGDLSTEAVVGAWIKMYTPSTLFALEYYPAFAGMLTNAYIGCYLNNQSTIEKVAGKDMISFVKSILEIRGV